MTLLFAIDKMAKSIAPLIKNVTPAAALALDSTQLITTSICVYKHPVKHAPVYEGGYMVLKNMCIA